MVRHSTLGAGLHHDLYEHEGKVANLREEDVTQEIKAWVRQSYLKQKTAILVSDMSGFTRLTRQYGIIHFASIIIRMRQLCLPILHHYGALLVTTEADNFIVVFPTAAGATMAAYRMQKTVEAYNNSLPAARSHFALTLNGVGVDFGWGPLVDKDDKLHGETFAHAYAIGEDLCDKGEVVLSGNVKTTIENTADYRKATFTLKNTDDEEEAKNIADAVGGLYTFASEENGNFGIASCDDARFLHPELIQFAYRHSPTLTEADLKKHDDMIKAKYQHDKVVLMFEFEYENAEETHKRIALKFGCLDLFKDIFVRYSAVAAEDVLYIFEDPASAVLTAVACRRRLNEENKKHQDTGAPHVTIKGFGVHVGMMLFVNGTDIHWGDPVNTASKLGQDLAQDGEIIISGETYQAVKGNPHIEALTLEPAELERSKVKFKCFKVWDSPCQRQGAFNHQPENTAYPAVTHAQPLLRMPSCPLAPRPPSPPTSPDMKGGRGVRQSQPWWATLANGFCCKQQSSAQPHANI